MLTDQEPARSPASSWKPMPWQTVTAILSLAFAGAFLLLPGAQEVMSSEFLYLFIKQDGPASLAALAVALAAAVAADRGGRMEGFFARLAAHPRWLAGLAVVVAGLGAWFAYHNHPLSMDEYSAWLQSQIFAAGRLTGQFPPALMDRLVLPGFQGYFIQVSHGTGAIASMYWPGLSLVMAPFSLAGVPWLCNPVLTGATLLGLARLLEEVAEDPPARGFGLFAAFASPVILVNGMSYYGMPLQLLCSVMFTLGVVRGTPRQLVAAGLWLGLGMTTVNPVPVGLYASAWVAWMLLRQPRPWRRLGWLALGWLPVVALLGLGWRLFLVHAVQDGGPPQFGVDLGAMLSVFRLPSGGLLAIRVVSLVKVWLWAVPGLVVLAVMACRDGGKGEWRVVFPAAAAMILVGYLFVPFDQGNGWGYRYFHAAWLVLPVLAALGLQRLAATPEGRRKAYGFAFVACLGSLLLSLPLRTSQVESFVRSYLDQIPVRLAGDGRQAVFVDVECGFRTYDLVQNDPLLRGNEIRLVSRGADQDAAAAALLGARPRLAASAACVRRWLLD